MVNPTYLHFYINNKRIREAYVYKFVTQSTISGINQNNLSKIQIMSPPIELQNQFADIVQQITDLDLSALETQATTLKQALTQELLA